MFESYGSGCGEPSSPPLLLTAQGRPVQGTAPNALTVETTQGPTSVAAWLHFGIVGLSQTGLPLGPTLGAAGCDLLAANDLILAVTAVPVTPGASV